MGKIIAGNQFVAIDMDQFIKINLDNSERSLAVLRWKEAWVHFEVISQVYNDLTPPQESFSSLNHHRMANLHYLISGSGNLVKGMSNVLAGHFSDSTMQARRTIEAVRHAMFLREQPDIANIWHEPDKREDYEKLYKDWFRGYGSKMMIKEFELSEIFFKLASSFGPHPNQQLFSFLHQVDCSKSMIGINVMYHEIEPSKKGYFDLMNFYYWHLIVHAHAIDWWIHKSNFVMHLKNEMKSYWTDCRMKIEKDRGVMIKEINEAGRCVACGHVNAFSVNT